MEVVAHRLAEELELSEAQQKQYDEIVARFQARAQERQEERARLRELGQQYREARQSGDDARAAEIRAQMREVGAGRGQLVREFLTEVETILDAGQVQKLQQFRERLRWAAQRGADAREWLRTLPDELGLEPAQRAQYELMLMEHRRRVAQDLEEWRAWRTELQGQLREAEAAGDSARVEELQAQLMEARPGPPDFEPFFEKLETILTDEQKAKLDELRDRFAPGVGRLEDVRTILQAAKRLKLNNEQEDRLKAIIRDAQAAERKGRRDPQSRSERAAAVKRQIMEILNADQKAEFERLLRQAERPRMRGPGQPGVEPAGPGREEGRARRHGERRQARSMP